MDKEAILARLSGSVEEIRQRFSVKALAIFGSVAREQTTDKSDVDVLVTFNQKANFDLFMDLKFYLEELLGIKVDLVTDKGLRTQMRQAIEREIIYVA